MQKIMIGVGAVLLILGTAHAAEEAKIDLSAVPAAVMATATKEAIGFKASSAHTEMEDGKKPVRSWCFLQNRLVHPSVHWPAVSAMTCCRLGLKRPQGASSC